MVTLRTVKVTFTFLVAFTVMVMVTGVKCLIELIPRLPTKAGSGLRAVSDPNVDRGGPDEDSVFELKNDVVTEPPKVELYLSVLAELLGEYDRVVNRLLMKELVSGRPDVLVSEDTSAECVDGVEVIATF